MVLPERIDAVVFDMGGVFIVPDPAVVSEILRRGGLECEIPTGIARNRPDIAGSARSPSESSA